MGTAGKVSRHKEGRKKKKGKGKGEEGREERRRIPRQRQSPACLPACLPFLACLAPAPFRRLAEERCVKMLLFLLEQIEKDG